MWSSVLYFQFTRREESLFKKRLAGLPSLPNIKMSLIFQTSPCILYIVLYLHPVDLWKQKTRKVTLLGGEWNSPDNFKRQNRKCHFEMFYPKWSDGFQNPSEATVWDCLPTEQTESWDHTSFRKQSSAYSQWIPILLCIFQSKLILSGLLSQELSLCSKQTFMFPKYWHIPFQRNPR